MFVGLKAFDGKLTNLLESKLSMTNYKFLGVKASGGRLRVCLMSNLVMTD